MILKSKLKLYRRENIDLELFSKKVKLSYVKKIFMKYHSKTSEYKSQLVAKRRLKLIYGVSEASLSKLSNYVLNSFKDSSLSILNYLEYRLDNVLYRSGFFCTRRTARQYIVHGFIFINDKRVSIPSFNVKDGIVINSKFFINKKLPSWFTLIKGNSFIKFNFYLFSYFISSNLDLDSVLAYYTR